MLFFEEALRCSLFLLRPRCPIQLFKCIRAIVVRCAPFRAQRDRLIEVIQRLTRIKQGCTPIIEVDSFLRLEPYGLAQSARAAFVPPSKYLASALRS
jgi:hypothetical protein